MSSRLRRQTYSTACRSPRPCPQVGLPCIRVDTKSPQVNVRTHPLLRPGCGGVRQTVRDEPNRSRRVGDVNSLNARHCEVIISQTKTRQRVRDLAEVYTHEREVTAMLDLVPDMFPSLERPRDIGRTFLEPACGAGNFLVAILDRKLAFVKFGGLYRSVATFETAVLKSLSTIYGIDID